MRTLALLLLALAATACASVNEPAAVDRSDSPVSRQDVLVYLQGDQVPGDCQRVATLNAGAGDEAAVDGLVVDRLREATGRMGGNAVLLNAATDGDAGSVGLYCPGQDPGSSPKSRIAFP